MLLANERHHFGEKAFDIIWGELVGAVEFPFFIAGAFFMLRWIIKQPIPVERGEVNWDKELENIKYINWYIGFLYVGMFTFFAWQFYSMYLEYL